MISWSPNPTFEVGYQFFLTEPNPLLFKFYMATGMHSRYKIRLENSLPRSVIPATSMLTKKPSCGTAVAWSGRRLAWRSFRSDGIAPNAQHHVAKNKHLLWAEAKHQKNLSTIPRHAHWNAIHKKNEQCKLISAHVPVADSDDLGILALKTESWVAPCPPSDHLVWSMSAGRYRRDTNKVRPHLWIKRLRESSALGADEGDDTDLTEKKEGGEERGEEDWHKI